MNVHAHLHGQVPVQVDEGGSKLPQQNGNSLAHHMQNGGANNMDHDLMMHRRKVQEIITQSLMRSAKFSSGQWVHKVSELARKLEERIFKSAISKEEYMNTTKMKVDQYLQAMMRTAPGKNQLSSHHILSSSAISTMMPTPGILHSVNTVNSVSSLGNSVMKTNGASMGQLPTANGSVGVGSNASLNSSNGPGYNVITADISDPGTFYNTSSSSVTPAVAIGEKVNSMSLHKKPKTDHTLLNHHVGLQSSQQTSQIKPQIFDSSQHMDFSKENLCSQNQMQNFQYQQFQQHNQLYDPQHNQSQPNKQHLSKTDCSRQSSTPSTVGGQSMQEGGIESKNGLSIPQSDQQYQMSEFPNEYRQKTITNINSLSKSSQFHCQLSSPQDFRRTFSQKQVLKSQNESTCLLNALEPKSNNLSSERQFHDEFQQRINGQVEDQKSQTLDGCTQPTLVSTKNVSIPVSSSGIGYGLDNPIQERNFRNQRRWLLFLLHSRRCSAPVGSCPEVHCWKIQKLWLHMQKCNSQACQYPYCFKSRQLLRHYHQCQVEVCPVCSYVRKFVATHNTPRDHSHINTSTEIQRNEPQETHLIGNNGSVGSASIETSDILKASSPKRLKAQHSCPSPTINRETSANNLPLPQGCQQAELIAVSKLEPVEIMIDPFSTMGSGDGHLKKIDTRDDEGSKNLIVARSDVTMPLALHETNDDARHETVRIEKEIDEAKIEVKQEANVPQVDAGSESGKPKIRGVSLTELFTPEQIREHIVSLRKWVGQSKAKAEKNQAMELSMSENSCQLCAVEKLTFESPPIYCTPCGFRIKRNAIYYTTPGADTRYYFCIPCYNESRGYTIEVDGSAVPKTRLEKRRNDDETEESWVQCDKCESWQHQICALFNARRNDGGQAEYSCPNCYVVEIKNGERKPLPQGAVLGAKDLPRSILSDHIEQRLFTRLKQERQERARHLGKRFDEVPGAEELVVRVVSSVDKKLEVKQQFLEIFKEENFPTDFPYKSKVILLFQRIEGVEVCLFGMYVQEFGSECQFPNQRRVYLSYLDSVKYFRPEIKTVTGEALRTFVYHEILIGYLEYCKKRGFASCYIWACPPPKGEDYILYCHPEIQKTPKSDKLREWYLAMLRKAAKENIVVELTNLYDHFFETIGECKAKVSAARLPYFEGDYLPGAAEDMINQLRLEEDGRKQQKKGTKILTKRALKAACQSDLSGNASKDALLMQKLGDTICLMKEDFIMVHLQHSCTHCCILMVSGTRWVCKQCKNFQLCQNCHDAEERLDVRNRHPITRREKHELFLVAINGVPSDTKDKDETLESEFFDTRQAFLNLCQLNHYQYDTLRRAKHASMMLLYHLHNPTAPAFLTTCNVCFCDIEAGQSWHCEFCTDFIVCSNCYHKEGGVDHPHKLSNHPSSTDHDTQNKKNQQQRELQQRILLDLLMHASQCKNVHCQYRNCRSMKNLFRHGIYCKTRAAGGCVTCKKVWYLLQLHARACKQSGCVVPRCKDLKEHFKRLQHQSETRRRASMMEMMRQRSAEVQGG